MTVTEPVEPLADRLRARAAHLDYLVSVAPPVRRPLYVEIAVELREAADAIDPPAVEPVDVLWTATAKTVTTEEEIWHGFAPTREAAALRFERWAVSYPIYGSIRVVIDRAGCVHGHSGSRVAACDLDAERLVDGFPFCGPHADWVAGAV